MIKINYSLMMLLYHIYTNNLYFTETAFALAPMKETRLIV